MTETSRAKAPALKTKDRIIVALDVETADEARRLIDKIGDEGSAYKIGLQLFTAAGPSFVRELTGSGTKIFLDLKFHDIPNTVAGASIEAAKLGVWMFNVHASGGGEMMRRSSDAVRTFCEREGCEIPIILGVTLLTSSNASTLLEDGITYSVEDYAIRLGVRAAKCGLGGIVASPREVAAIRKSIKSEPFIVVTPGIRPISATHDDQKRVMTPAEAVTAGSDYLVIGRPVTAAPNPTAALRKIIEEIDQAN